MINKYPLWKNLLLIFLSAFAFLYAVPNLFLEYPSVQVSLSNGEAIPVGVQKQIEELLQQQRLTFSHIRQENNEIEIRFNSTDTQLQANDLIKQNLGDKYTVALTLASATPAWLRAIGAHPMKLGLDLRGGIHFLLDVDVNSVIKSKMQGYVRSIADELRQEKLRYSGLQFQPNTEQIQINFRDEATLANALPTLKNKFPDLEFARTNTPGIWQIDAVLTPVSYNNIRQYTIEQTMMILRNRVNELGVSEAVVQQQGGTRISVDLPGVQDATHAKQILGGTATLELHLVDQEHDPQTAVSTGITPIGSRLYNDNGRPLLLKDRVLLSGQSISGAIATIGENGRPAVNIQAGGSEISEFHRVTGQNVGNAMAIVYIETKTNTTMIDGKPIKTRNKIEKIISVATIQSALGNSFVVTNMTNMHEAQNLALLLRAGALIAPIDTVEERLIGPSLGAENIHKGLVSILVGFAFVVLFMAFYYRIFGLIADIALFMNLVFIVAIMSLVGMVLSLPGMAGVVLTVGMAVDANVLIFERIREELRNAVSPQAAIHAGFERAFNTIVDANVTTLIVAIILFGVGTGPIKGFAVTVTIGILTSMVTAITFTRAIVNWIYGGRSVKRLSIGI